MADPEFANNLGQEIMTTATLVVNLLREEFDPLPSDIIDQTNSGTPKANREHLVMLSGSDRSFSTEDITTGTPLHVSEMYFAAEDDMDGIHLLTLWVEREYYDFLFAIDLDTGDMAIETDRSGGSVGLNPTQYPAISNRVLGSLALIAGDLF
jgi:hypothetical protein